MNVGPGGKQPVMKDTGKVQRLVNDSGIPKGMKLVLQERGVDTFAMKTFKVSKHLWKGVPHMFVFP